MKYNAVCLGLALTMGLAGGVQGAGSEGIAPEELGLSKTSVFEVPEQESFAYTEGFPDEPAASPPPGTPPMIPHGIAALVPVTVKDNQCLGCHDKPELIGQKAHTLPTPIPASHYQNLWNASESMKLDGSRYVCTQCHAPQADVKPLVDNRF